MNPRIRRFAPVLALATLLSCAGQDLFLLDDPQGDADAEADRLHKMQMVRLIDPQGTVVEVEAADAAWASVFGCYIEATEEVGLSVECPYAMEAHTALCAANKMLSMAAIRAEPLPLDINDDQVPEYTVPAQSEATNAALTRQAMSLSMAAAAYAIEPLVKATGGTVPVQYMLLNTSFAFPGVPGACDLTMGTANHGPPVGGLLATMFVEAYHLHGEATQRGVDATVAVAEAQRSSTSSPVEKAAREVAGAELSRAHAAHLLVGGKPGLDGSTTKGFCSTPELSQQVQLAISLFREAAVDPAKILDEPPVDGNGGLTLEELLDGDLTDVDDGSVRYRLAETWDYQDLAAASSSITTFFQLKTSDFVEARHYLAQEIRAFARTRTKTLEKKELVGGLKSTFPVYAATARPPGPQDLAYFSTLARTGRNDAGVIGDSLSTFPTTPNRVYGADPQAINAASLIERGLSDVVQVVKNENLLDPAVRQAIVGPLGTLAPATRKERSGRLIVSCASNNVCIQTLYGFGRTDALLFVRGEDGLRCAVQGSVEGAACDMHDYNLNVQSALDIPAYGYEKAARFLTDGLHLGERAYVVVPTGPGADPGTYRALTGFAMTDYGEVYDAPMVPFADKWAAHLLEPNRDWCSRSELTCAGTTFDERLPLEDELSSDGDDVESSWKHYLVLAREAADKADALGEDYITASLASDQWDNQTSLQQLDKKLRVEAELEKIQAICGTAIEPGKLMELLGFDLSGTVKAVACTSDQNCEPAKGQICIVGACIVDPKNFASAHPEDAELTRLAECLGSDTTAPYASMGNVALCLWHRSGNPNYLCESWSEKNGCPYLPQNAEDYLKDPPPAAPVCDYEGHHVPGGQDPASTVPLGFFDLFANPPAPPTNSVTPLVDEMGNPVDPSDPQTQSMDICRLVRELRQEKSGSKINLLKVSNFFNPDNLGEFAGVVGWEARPGGFSAITLDKVVLWDTGSLEKEAAGTLDAEAAGWPCFAGALAAECATTQDGLFCDSHVGACTSTTSRMALNFRMLHAVEAARFLGVLKGQPIFTGILYPTYIPESAIAGWTTNTAPYPGHPPYLLTTHADKAWVAYEADANVGTAWGNWEYTTPWPRVFAIGDVRADGSPVLGQSLGTDGWWNGLSLKNGSAVALTDLATNTSVAGKENQWIHNMLQRTVADVPFPYAEDLPDWEPLTNPPQDLSEFGATQKVLQSLAHYGFKWRGWESRGQASVVKPPVADPYFGGDAFWYYYGPNLPDGTQWGAQHTEVLHDRTVLVPPMSSDEVGQALLDGMELLCAVGLKKATPCSAKDPPAVNTVHDLAKARDFLTCVGSDMQARAGMTVFAKLPQRAVDLMKKSSVAGAYPMVGGNFGAAVAEVRGALIQASETSSKIGTEVRQFGIDLDSLRLALVNADLTDQMASVQFMSTVSNQIASCSVAGANAISDFGPGSAGAALGAVATCANSIAQIEFAGQLNALEQAQSGLAKDAALLALKQSFETRAATLSNLGTELRAATERIDAQLALIEGMQNEAKRALSKAAYMASFQAEKQLEINTAMRARVNTTRMRYEEAHKNAILHTFLAKRAIEQRLGIELSSVVDDLPLVSAPALWEADLCTMTGVDYAAISDPKAAENVNYANTFIGDYVTKLENMLESYRLTYNFHEGSDTAVISLRDDVVKARHDCETDVGNLLHQAGQLEHLTVDQVADPGWQLDTCATAAGPNGPELLPNCIFAASLGSSPFPGVMPHPDMGNAVGYVVRFGLGTGVCAPTDTTCGFRAGSALTQPVTLHPGRYRMSWYGNPGKSPVSSTYDDDAVTVIAGGSEVTRITLPSGATVGEVHLDDFWPRYYFLFDVDATEDANVAIRMPAGMVAPTEVKLAALMLEDASTSAVGPDAAYEPRVFANTTEKLTRVRPVCEDTHGEVFRRKNWTRSCVLLCPDGFDGACSASDATTHCYRELAFSINQRAIESGSILKASGFAKGNFNYRIQRVGVNFVGTGIRDCTDSTLPSSCSGAGFATYSIVHNGPYFVRNALGNDFRAHLFTGKIEQARGLAAERYLTNPISETDRTLIEQYLRHELNGRPLDGQFVVRVWEEPDVNFEAIEDVQLVLDYRYWTHFD